MPRSVPKDRSQIERLILDTSVFSRIEALDAVEQEHFLQQFDGTARRVRLIPEIISEVVAVAGTGKESRLPGRCRILHGFSDLPPVQPFPQIVHSELSGEGIFLSDTDHDNLRKVLQILAAGSAPGKKLRELHLVLHENKDGPYEGYRKIKRAVLEKMRGKKSLAGVPFDEFFSMRCEVHRQHLEDLIAGVPGAAPVSMALKDSKRYPYTFAFLRAEAAIVYRHDILDRPVDPGDVNDAIAVMCLAGADSLISEDKGLRELGALVWRDTKRIVDFDAWRSSSA